MKPQFTVLTPDVRVTIRTTKASDPHPGGTWNNCGLGNYVAVGTVNPITAEMFAQVSYVDATGKLVELTGTPTTIPGGYQWAFLFSNVPVTTMVTVQATGNTDDDSGSATPDNTTTA